VGVPRSWRAGRGAPPEGREITGAADGAVERRNGAVPVEFEGRVQSEQWLAWMEIEENTTMVSTLHQSLSVSK
jgi:hypothetical protein